VTSRRRFLASLATLAAGATLAGCGYYPGGGDIRWREESLGGLYRTDEVAVAGETLYTVTDSTQSYDVEEETWTRGAEVVAYDTADGSERYSEGFEERARAFGVGESDVAVGLGSDDTGLGGEGPSSSAVARIGPDGRQWTVTVDAAVEQLAVADERVYAVTAEGALVACADGEVRWRRGSYDLGNAGPDRESSALVGAGPAGVVLADGGEPVHLAPDGTERWRRPDISHVQQVVDVGSDRVHVADETTLYALAAESGESRWTAQESADLPEYALGRARYHRTGGDFYRVVDAELHALDDTGETRWTNEGVERETNVAAGETSVFVHTGSGVTALSADDGSRNWTVEYDRIDAGPFLVDAGVLVVSGQGVTCHVPRG